ncbi:MAG: hypothetical protein HON70_45370, partial [Lentisphaerae bacterium]|nr:hypothetical protein [Lentisphaerota bacterium]
MNDQRGRADKIAREIAEVSPLALPQYLAECEFYDMEDTRDVLDRAVSEFEDAGGVGANLANTVVVSLANSCTLLLFKKFHEPTYRKMVKGKVNISQIVDRCLNFQYPASQPSPVQTTSQAFQHDRLRRDASNIDKSYNGDNYRDKSQKTKENPEGNRNSQFRNSQLSESGTAKDITGRDVHARESAPTGADGKPLRSKVGEADHVKPLKLIHEENGSFVRRYSDEADIKAIVNSDENFQLLAGDMNASKGGGKTNQQFIEYVEAIDSASEVYGKPEAQRTDEDKAVLKKLNGTQKKAAKLKARAKAGKLTDDERRELE